MDVRCNRCGTEYEFDDALVSERGTTVKCTNCGHQFKVYPGGSGARVPERWIVRKASGRELVYTSLKDLQRAIAQRQVGPNDLLSRGGGQPLRPLGGIAELEPFFHGQVTGQPRTLLGMAPSGAGDAASPGFPDPVQASHGTGASGAYPAPAASVSVPAPSPAIASEHRVPPVIEPEPATLPRSGVAEYAHPAQPQPLHQVPPTPTPNAIDEAFRAYDEAYTDPRYVPPGTGRRSWIRWLVALVLIGAVAFVVVTVGKQYGDRFLPKADEASGPRSADARVAEMLELGAERLNAGDLEGAKEQFDKASVLSEKDPQVLSSLARLEAARADIHWLGLKLIPEEDETARSAEQKLLEGRLVKVRQVTDRAAAAASNEPVVVRARIDAHRLAGELDKARGLVSSLGGDASDPETAYVLAALDLAEPRPSWNTVIDRLRTATAVEGDLGRARAALVYALARAGRVAEAKAELDKMHAARHASPLVEALQRFVGQAKPSDAGAAEDPSKAADELESAPAPGTPAAGEPSAAGMDFRRLLEEASRAKSRGDLNRAEMYYRQARDKQPGNVEALAGLGDVARSRGDTAEAARYYESVLASNPSYLPAIMASADMKWGAGDRAGAVNLYRRAVQQSGAGSSYGQRAQARISEYESSKASSQSSEGPDEPSAPSEPEVPVPTPPSQPEAPEIDTTDLPGFQ